jgi:hypothetical protein
VTLLKATRQRPVDDGGGAPRHAQHTHAALSKLRVAVPCGCIGLQGSEALV